MRHTTRFLIILLLLAPAAAGARGQDDPQASNVNSRYPVESVTLTGVKTSAVSRSLRADMRHLVGQNYDQGAINDLAVRLTDELKNYAVDVKVERGNTADHLKVVFDARRRVNRRFDAHASRLLYYSDQGFSADLGVGVETHQNHFSFGLLSTSDELVERNAGYRLRYEHRSVGTDVVQIGVEFDRYHPTFDDRVFGALSASPGMPATYRLRQNFAPSVSILPVGSVKFTAGVSLENLDFEAPAASSARAYAVTFDAQYSEKVRGAGGYRHSVVAAYGIRRATPALHSDFEYTRHLASGDYTLSKGRHLFAVHAEGGATSGVAPLFERFTLGNSARLRGWNKFDVAPLGGSRLAYGSLEYRYGLFQLFYDVGSVWDADRPASAKHAVGVGLATRNGLFLSLGFPVRLHQVSPVVTFGFRY